MITRIFIITLGIFLLLKSNKANAPRGIRNNNPLNIRDNAANNWQGKTGVDDLDFVVFDDPINGIRAAGKILISYRRRGNYTIENIINTWSPIVGKDANGNEYKNNTQNYVDFVERETGINKNQPLQIEDYYLILPSMIKFENGEQPYSIRTISDGLKLGLA